MRVSDAIEVIADQLKSDSGYRQGWLDNIAMSFKDEWSRAVDDGGLPATSEQIHVIANKAADNFLNLLCKEQQ